MNLKQLRTFLHVAELGKLSGASDRLGTAQPALSRQIRLLEDELGIKLFRRHGRGMALTSAGDKLRERAGFLIRYLEETRSEIQSYAGAVRGKIVVSMPETLAEVIAVELIETFVHKFPETSVRFVTGLSGHILDWLQRGEVDIAVLYGPQFEAMLVVEKLFDEELHFVFKPGLLPSNQHEITFADVCSQPLVLPAQQHGLRGLLDAHAKALGLKLNVQLETDSFRILTNLAARGLYSTVLPARPIMYEIEAGRIDILPIVDPTPSRTLHLAMPMDRPITTAVRVFSEELKSIVSKLVVSG